MWKYLRTITLHISTDTTYAILPEAQTISSWLAQKKEAAAYMNSPSFQQKDR